MIHLRSMSTSSSGEVKVKKSQTITARCDQWTRENWALHVKCPGCKRLSLRAMISTLGSQGIGYRFESSENWLNFMDLPLLCFSPPIFQSYSWPRWCLIVFKLSWSSEGDPLWDLGIWLWIQVMLPAILWPSPRDFQTLRQKSRRIHNPHAHKYTLTRKHANGWIKNGLPHKSQWLSRRFDSSRSQAFCLECFGKGWPLKLFPAKWKSSTRVISEIEHGYLCAWSVWTVGALFIWNHVPAANPRNPTRE